MRPKFAVGDLCIDWDGDVFEILNIDKEYAIIYLTGHSLNNSYDIENMDNEENIRLLTPLEKEML